MEDAEDKAGASMDSTAGKEDKAGVNVGALGCVLTYTDNREDSEAHPNKIFVEPAQLNAVLSRVRDTKIHLIWGGDCYLCLHGAAEQVRVVDEAPKRTTNLRLIALVERELRFLPVGFS